MAKYKLSAIERKILQKLDINPRATVTQIAKYARTSQENTTYHLKKLQEKDILLGCSAFPTLDKQTCIYKMFFKDKGLGRVKDTFTEFLRAHKTVVWVAELQGTWDFTVSIHAKSESQAAKTINDILTEYGHVLGERTIIRMSKTYSLNEKYLHDEHYVRVAVEDFTRPRAEHDILDKQIQRMLMTNGRATYAEIARETGTSPETARQRTKNIIKEDIFDFLIRVNHKKLGLTYYHIMITLQDYSIKEELTNYYLEHKNCVFLVHHIGPYDIHLEMVSTDEQMREIITEFSEKFGNKITRYDVIYILDEYFTPLRFQEQ